MLAPPKTSASLRDVPMPQFLLDAVNRHAEQLALGEGDVLCRPRGTLRRRDYYNREIWKPAIAAAGLPADTTFHDLRHTFCQAPRLPKACLSPRSPAGLVTSRSPPPLTDLCGHLVPEASGRAHDALDKAFGRAQAHVPGKCPG